MAEDVEQSRPEDVKQSRVIGPQTLHTDDRHEHVLLGGHSESRWFGQTHALIGKGGVLLHAIDSREHSVTSLYLTEAEMEALIEVWNRRHARVEESKT